MQIVLDVRLVLKEMGLDWRRFEESGILEKRPHESAGSESANIFTDKMIGQIIKYDIVSEAGLLLIPSRTKITWGHLKLLQQHRVQAAEIVVTGEAPSVTATVVAEATQYAKDLFYRIRTNRKIPLLEIRSGLIPLIHQVSEHEDLFQILESIKSKDDYTYKHSVGVGVLATLIGRWLGLDSSELSLLSTAATLHDVGKMRISQDLLQKPEKLTPAEFEEMKRHTIYGYEMLKETPGLNQRIALVALQHHERVDGIGYPLKLKEEQIDRLSRIVAVADVFHAMTSNRPYQVALPFHEVVEQMRTSTFYGLDPHIVNAFLKHIYSNLIGRKVVLTDGRWGEVVYINPHDHLKPLIQTKHAFLDLSKERDIDIREIIA